MMQVKMNENGVNFKQEPEPFLRLRDEELKYLMFADCFEIVDTKEDIDKYFLDSSDSNQNDSNGNSDDQSFQLRDVMADEAI